MLAAAAVSACSFFAASGASAPIVFAASGTSAPIVPLRLHTIQCSAAVSIAVCTGSSCESRCSFNCARAFENLANDGDITVAEIRCMNMCKRGPAVRIVADETVATVEQRMNELERKRTAFQNVASLARVEAVFSVAEGIADGSLADAHGEFTVTQHGPLPPSAM